MAKNTFSDRRIGGNGALISTQTRAHHKPKAGTTNISLDFNASESGTARGTEVIIPDDASPELRAAATLYNQRIVEFARANGIPDYPNRGVKTRSENGRGVSHTAHAEPFFNSDAAMQAAVQKNMGQFSQIYADTFGTLPNARIIAPHGVGADRGAASSVFGNETDFGVSVIKAMMGQGVSQGAAARVAKRAAELVAQGVDRSLAIGAATKEMESAPAQAQPQTYARAPVSNDAFSAAMGQLGIDAGAMGADQSQGYSLAQRMGGVGSALMALDQGVAPPPMMLGAQNQGPPPLADLFGKVKQMEIFNKPKGISL